MRVLVGCEYSGRVRDEFSKLGHIAVSCDLRASESPGGGHIQHDLLEVLACGADSWDLMIAHPYCTYNNQAGVRWMYHPDDTHLPAHVRRRHPRYPDRMDDFLKGVAFFNTLKNCDIPQIVLENSIPHGLAVEHIGPYDQLVQPYHFGSPYTKAACLWVKGLPLLQPRFKKGDYLPGEIKDVCHRMVPGPNREKERSRTDLAIAREFAAAWG